MSSERDAYEVMQVGVDAEQAVIHAAFRALARRYHPDGTDPEPARMVELNHAYDKLRTAERRFEYDRRRRPAQVLGQRSQAVPSAVFSLGPLGQRMALRDESPILDFGAYAGWPIGFVARHDPDYLRWLSRHSMGVRFLHAIVQALGNDREIGRRGAVLR